MQAGLGIDASDRISQAVREQEEGITGIESRGLRFILSVAEQSQRQTGRFQKFEHAITKDDRRIVARIHVGQFPRIPVQEQENRRRKKSWRRVAAEMLVNLLSECQEFGSDARHASNQRLYV